MSGDVARPRSGAAPRSVGDAQPAQRARAAVPKIKRPRGWNNWTRSEKWQDDPVVDADPGGCLVMGDLAELLLTMPEAEGADRKYDGWLCLMSRNVRGPAVLMAMHICT
ncbi:hypothetical protein C2E20_9270 [Micractinium conductrix]|uniref:Uncharacterized protein n=1 Tax=Micractinium conductrix TaxID=554055 RepID=A0A2P6UYY7_9CHLO|nr:hypothetical protein C2E20_9270 [Micractinium conductrix]|eukprot:PSC67057.1 hypothetical protein C2E20_9270 [Micractinium conductrix]